MQYYSIFWLFPLLLPFVQCTDVCTQGFMDYELLRVKADQIGDSTIDDTVTPIGAKTSSRTLVLPALNFSCVGAITGFLLAVDIRIVGDGDKYPWIGLFNHNVDSNTYILVSGTLRNIILGPDDFSTSGLYNYTLSSPIQFTSGNIIGIYQPAHDDSIVRLQQKRQHTSTDTTDRIRINNDGTIVSKHVNSSTLLILPLTSNHTSCLNSGFFSQEDLLINARLVGLVSEFYGIFSDNNVFFKDIRFTCNGSITNIIVGMKLKANDESSSSVPPEIRIWRSSNGGNTYTQSGPTIPLNYSDAVSDISTDYLRWYNLSVPVPVKEGDVLGIYHDSVLGNHESIINHQRYSGPYNYYSSNCNDKVFDYNIYPLVSVVVSEGTDASLYNASIPSSLAQVLSSSCSQLSASADVGLTTTSYDTQNSNSLSNDQLLLIVIPVVVIQSIICCLLCLFASSIGVVYLRKTRVNKQKINNESPEDPNSELNEAYGVIDQTPMDTYDYIDGSKGGRTDSISISIKMDLNDSYGRLRS